MIFKKPYAFLIKNFRKIHLLFTIILGYTCYKMIKLTAFFRDNLVNENLINVPDDLLNALFFLALIALVAFGITMFILMKQKDKPSKFYIFVVIYYSLLVILFFFASSIVKEIAETNVMSLEIRRAYRDLANIFSFPQYIFLIFFLIRTIGFDIKKFDFGKDLKELAISESDNEEFEFVVGIDTDKIMTRFRKSMREFKYYFLENIKVFVILFLVLIVTGGGYIGYTLIFGQKQYKESENIANGKYNVTVLNSYITNISQNGTVISKDKYFLVVSTKIKYFTSKPATLNTSDFKVYFGDAAYLPVIHRNNYFVDLGKPYNKESLESGKDYYFLLVYELSEYKDAKGYVLKVSGNTSYNKQGEQVVNYSSINLNPVVSENVKTTETITFDENNPKNVLDFGNTSLKETYIKFRSFDINARFEYKYKHCYTESDCRELTGIVSANTMASNSTLLILDATLSLDENSLYAKYNKDKITFFNNFMIINYTVNGEEKRIVGKVKNTADYEDKMIFEVPVTLEQATDIKLEFTIRNSKHIIILK